ncbi:MAG: alpha-L-fucosidase [Clostridiaceae bacterium]|nr:alpha-L-fucosidase [Clostridiaceae bacterium]
MEAKLKQINEMIDQGPFSDSWDSLANRRIPQWYKNAKFGIFIHWGVYSVPAYANEWYPRGMYIQGSDEFNHHVETYGPHNKFGYKDFIPMFEAEKFDADEWAELFKEAGAKYVIPVAEHHDGFQMYRSEISKWNAAEMGPRRDIIGELTEAFGRHGLVSGASTHRVEHWFFMGHGKEFDSDIKEPLQRGDFYWPAMPEQNHYDLFSEPTPTHEFLEDWLVRCCEIVDRFQPKIVYFDWWIQHQSVKPYLKKFAAYYYNHAAKNGYEAVINYKHDAFQFGTAVVDIERGQFSEVKPFWWQTDTSIAKNSWCYTENNDFKKTEVILCDLVDIVSKNGCMLLNVGPKADGTICDEEKKVLKEIGSWLKTNGEAVFDTNIWRLAGEGPTKVEEGHFTDSKDKEFTAEDFRFTVKGSYLYATCLNYPENGQVCIKSLAENDASKLPLFHGIIKEVDVLGSDFKPSYKRDALGLHIQTQKVMSKNPVVFKIKID